MLLNDDIVCIEKPDGICSLTFVAGKFSGLFFFFKKRLKICLVIPLNNADDIVTAR